MADVCILLKIYYYYCHYHYLCYFYFIYSDFLNFGHNVRTHACDMETKN